MSQENQSCINCYSTENVVIDHNDQQYKCKYRCHICAKSTCKWLTCEGCGYEKVCGNCIDDEGKCCFCRIRRAILLIYQPFLMTVLEPERKVSKSKRTKIKKNNNRFFNIRKSKWKKLK